MLCYVTSNNLKFDDAVKRLKNYGIELRQAQLDLDEIQSYSVEKIANHKAVSAFEELKIPLLISDVEWNIPALNGFPGAFMAYVDTWFNMDDFLRLMKGIEDRRIICTEVIVYIDRRQTKLFKSSAEGVILEEGGATDNTSADSIISFRSDKKSLSQARLENIPIFDQELTVYGKFAQWFTSSK